MHAYFFANYRLLADEGIANHESIKRQLTEFETPMPYTHTFTLRLGDADELEEKRAWALGYPVAYRVGSATLHDTDDGWAFVSRQRWGGPRNVVLCSRDWGDIVAWLTDSIYDKYSIIHACNMGMAMRDGLLLHAALVEKDGFGVVFLGTYGRGKSTQAKLWEKCLGADIICDDMCIMRKIDGKWLGFGMPWDSPDTLTRQTSVPVRTLVKLEQAEENSISPMTPVQALSVMLQQVRIPVWDNTAVDGAVPLMGQLVRDLPMIRLRCLPDEAAARLTYDTIRKE